MKERTVKCCRGTWGIRHFLCRAAGLASALLTAGSAVLLAACLSMALREKMTGELSFFFGYKPVYIESGSMEPSIRTGEVILIKKCSYENISEGDILLFRTGQGYAAHRFVGIDREALMAGQSSYLITKGDANSIEDPDRLDPEMIEGKVVKLW